MTDVQKKSRRCLYGSVVENLEKNSKKTIRTAGSLKFFQNKKIDTQLKILLEYDNDNNIEQNRVYKSSPKKLLKRKNKKRNHIKQSKIRILHHKSSGKKRYYSSKTQKPKKKIKNNKIKKN